MKIILTGFMGAGKTTVAGILNRLHRVEILEMDDLVLKASAHESIGEIFDQEGEEAFRALERKVAADIADMEGGMVVSTGGGVGANAELIELMRGGRGEGVKVVHLYASFDEVVDRLKGDTKRPLMRDLGKARALFEERAPHYQANADVTVSTESNEWEEIAREVARVAGLEG